VTVETETLAEPAVAERAPASIERSTPQSGQKEASRRQFRRRAAIVAAIIVASVFVVAIGGWWWLSGRDYESTDDAFIDARPSAIGAQVEGAIVDVPVTDNEIVEPGATLARIDDRNYVSLRDQAQAAVAVAEAAIVANGAQTNAQQSAVSQASLTADQAKAALSFSVDQNNRAQSLLQTGAGTLQQAQQTQSDLKQKQAAYDASEAAFEQAKGQLAVLAAQKDSAEAQSAQARAQLSQAEINLSRTTIVAPFKGRVTQLTAAKGAWAAPGQTLMLIVPLDVWVTANFRETQLVDMRPGQPVSIAIDAYGRTFPGHVDSVQAGSGTAFSLLPAENATGNYVKIVQRVPVKLVFDHPPDLELGPGMSVSPSVKVR
jgi:membrane fusion protein, multidrug efflux system